eukprot:SAG31_NODE_13679_length_853_cov_1.721485_2_plen_34_part_01
MVPIWSRCVSDTEFQLLLREFARDIEDYLQTRHA